MEHHLFSDSDIAPQAAAPLAMPPSDVIALAGPQRKPGQRHVSVAAAVQLAVFAAAAVIFLELINDTPGLVELRPAIMHIQNFLDCHHVRIKLGDDRSNPFRTGAPVRPATFVHVLGSDPDAHYCWRSSTQPSSSGARSSTGRRRHCS